jgi:O-antigen/teichoic acid export membrane protein
MKILEQSGGRFLKAIDSTNNSISNSNLLPHFLTIGMGTIINIFLSLLTTPIITRVVDPSEYGQLSIFNMYTSIALMVLCIGLDQALVRYYYDKDIIEYKRGLLMLCFKLPMIVSVVCSVIVMITSYFGLLEFEFKPMLMGLLCINVVVNIWNRISVLLLRVTYQSKKYAISNIIYKLTYIIVAIPLVLIIKNENLVLLAIATIISYLIPSIYATISTREYWRFSKTEKLDNTKEIIRYGLPFILSMGLTTLFQTIDKISLNYYCSYSEVGIYSSAMTIVNIFTIIQTTFNSLWGPMQVEHYTKNPEDTSFIRNGNRYITVIMFFIGMSLILCKDIFALLLGEKYRQASYILPFLIFNPIMYTISETTCSGIGISKKSYLNIIISIGACLTNFIGNTILVPKLGSQGAAISTGVSYIIFFALRTIFSNKYYYIDYALKKFAIITGVTLIYAWYGTFNKFSIFMVLGYVVCIVVLTLLYWKDIKECYLITKKQLFQIIKRKNV